MAFNSSSVCLRFVQHKSTHQVESLITTSHLNFKAGNLNENLHIIYVLICLKLWCIVTIISLRILKCRNAVSSMRRQVRPLPAIFWMTVLMHNVQWIPLWRLLYEGFGSVRTEIYTAKCTLPCICYKEVDITSNCTFRVDLHYNNCFHDNVRSKLLSVVTTTALWYPPDGLWIRMNETCYDCNHKLYVTSYYCDRCSRSGLLIWLVLWSTMTNHRHFIHFF